MTDWPSDSLEGRLEAALRRVAVIPPHEPDTGEGIPFHTLIPGLARQLAILGTRRGNAPNRYGAASTAATQKELASLHKCAKALLQALDALHEPAIDALDFRSGWQDGFRSQLRVLEIVVSSAEIRPLPTNAGKGAKAKILPSEVTKFAIICYEGLSGKIATRRNTIDDGKAYGPFFVFLSDIFNILNISASADNQARKYLME